MGHKKYHEQLNCNINIYSRILTVCNALNTTWYRQVNEIIIQISEETSTTFKKK